MIGTTLDAENTIVLDRCNHIYMFTNISDMDAKYATLKNSAKYNLNTINLEINL